MRAFLLSLPWMLATAAAGQGLPVAQSVDGLSVRDAAGTAYPYPFAGGFGSAAGYLAPKPQLVDLVGDARPDLVLTDGGVGLQLYENVGAGGPGFGFRWRTDALPAAGGAPLAPGAWFRFGDLDGDGDGDLLAQAGPTQMRYWRNDGPGPDGLPVLTLLADPLLATDGEPAYSDDNSVPAFFDHDGDGDLDFLFGQVDRGNVGLWRNDGPDAQGRPRLTFVTDTFEGLEIYEANPTCEAALDGPGGFPGLERPAPGGFPGLGGRPGSGGRPSTRHGANALAFADLDGDGDREFFWGDYFSRSLWFFRNDGTPVDAAFTFVSEAFPLDEPLTSGGYNVASFADVDLDGDLDLVFGILGGLCATAQNWFDALFYYENVGTPQAATFTLRTPRLIAGVDVGRRSVPALGDLDGDGDLDLVVANESDPASPSSANLALYRNTGSAAAPDWRLEDADWLGLDYDFGGYGATLADLDADGDLDLLVGSLNGRFALMRNTGTPTAPAFTRENDRFFDLDVGQFSRVAVGDLDGDGDPDLLAGDAAGRLRLYRNTGTAQAPAFVHASGLPVPEDNTFRDAIGLPADVGDFSAPALVDVDGDGDLDVLLGTDAGPVRFYRNTGTPQAPQFAEGPPVSAARRTTTPAVADLDGDGDVDVLTGTAGGGLLLFLGTTVTPAVEGAPSGSGARLDSIPNPASGAVTFRLDPGTAAGRLAVVVADAQGREVWRGAVPTGADRVAWGGAAAGVYLARLEADGAPLATAKVTLLR